MKQFATTTTWQIIATTGRPLASAETEGGAWLRLLEWDGTAFDGRRLLRAVDHFRAIGYRAVEMRRAKTDNPEQEAHGQTDGRL